MTEKQKNDVLYVCSLIETIARKTKNHRQDVIRHFTKADVERQLRLAEVNHCLSFEQVSDELIDDFQVDGVVDLVLQACHTYNVETALVKKLVKDKKGIPYTVVETDYSQADIEQINTRMAAFIEML